MRDRISERPLLLSVVSHYLQADHESNAFIEWFSILPICADAFRPKCLSLTQLCSHLPPPILASVPVSQVLSLSNYPVVMEFCFPKGRSQHEMLLAERFKLTFTAAGIAPVIFGTPPPSLHDFPVGFVRKVSTNTIPVFLLFRGKQRSS
ncbi:hypothetical protein BKA80DRAFT_117884 [Phyllosticta citrichinensis]